MFGKVRDGKFHPSLTQTGYTLALITVYLLVPTAVFLKYVTGTEWIQLITVTTPFVIGNAIGGKFTENRSNTGI